MSLSIRAKGNEAAVVLHAESMLFTGTTRSGRNKLFTAFMRTKAWLRISGIGKPAAQFCDR